RWLRAASSARRNSASCVASVAGGRAIPWCMNIPRGMSGDVPAARAFRGECWDGDVAAGEHSAGNVGDGDVAAGEHSAGNVGDGDGSVVERIRAASGADHGRLWV